MTLEDKYSESSISLLIDFLFEFLTVSPKEAKESQEVCTQIVNNLNEIQDEVLESLQDSEKEQKEYIKASLDEIFGKIYKINTLYQDLLDESLQDWFKKAIQAEELIELLRYFESQKLNTPGDVKQPGTPG